MQTKQNYARGLNVSKPRDNAPTFMHSNIAIKLDKFIEWANQNTNAEGFVNIEVKINDKQELYAVLNEFFHKDNQPKPVSPAVEVFDKQLLTEEKPVVFSVDEEAASEPYSSEDIDALFDKAFGK